MSFFDRYKIIITHLVLILPVSNETKVSFARWCGVKVGKNCRIFMCNFGSEPYLVSLGDHCEITAGVKFITHDGGTWVLQTDKDKKFEGTKFGPIIIRDNCMIGINTILLPDVEIGPNSIVGAGSVVTKNVLPNSVYAGNPAKFICTLDQYLDNCKIKDTGRITKNKEDYLNEIFDKRF